jgi:hypothetical protein
VSRQPAAGGRATASGRDVRACRYRNLSNERGSPTRPLTEPVLSRFARCMATAQRLPLCGGGPTPVVRVPAAGSGGAHYSARCWDPAGSTGDLGEWSAAGCCQRRRGHHGNDDRGDLEACLRRI